MAVPAAGRVRSVDILRGLVCVLMAIDHVRVYAGIPAGGPTPGIFLTRWITHFVAPAFCLFAGTSAFFMGRQSGDLPALSRFLVTRGLLLVVLELTLMRFAWAFTVGTDFMLAGVIWMLGWSMVVLGFLVRMPAQRVGWIGVGIVALQQLLNLPPRLIGAIAGPWSFIYNSPAESAPFGINVLYVLMPWAGLMLAGYGFGLLFDGEPVTRDKRFVKLGVGMMLAWLLLGVTVALIRGGDAGSGGDGPSPPLWMQVLNQQKYPASQLFLLMTLGPMIAMLPWAARAQGFISDALDTIGRVPMFYYIAHLFVIHVLAIVTMRVAFGNFDAAWYATAPYTQVPPDHRWSLGMLYLVWAAALVILYLMCRWYAQKKRHAPSRWMAYI